MSNSVSVTGIVQDGAGRPVANAIVMIVDGPAPFNDMASVTDSQGGFALSNLTPGTYTLQVQSEGRSIQQAVQVQGGGQVRVTI